MKKNVAGQIVCAQLVAKSDGSDVTTGTTDVYVLGDGAIQALSGVSPSGAVHEGNGLWSFMVSAADTNYDHVVFTFKNSLAVTASIQIYTSYPQTGDNYARLGAPAGASVSADVAAVKAVLPSALVSGRIDASVGAYQTGLAPLQPTTAGRTLDVTATGEAGIDWANIGAPTTSVNLSGTTIATTQKVDVETIKTQAVTAAAGVTFPTSIASPTNITAGTITTATNLTNAPTAGDFTATMKTSIGTAVAASAVASVTGAVGSVTGNVGGNVTGSVGSVVGLTASDVGAIKTSTDILAGMVESAPGSPNYYRFKTAGLEMAWEVASAGHGSGTTGQALASAGSAGDPWITALPGTYTAGQAGYIVGTNINATISSRLPTSSYVAPLDAAGTRTAVGLATANLDTQLDALPTNAELATALGTADDAVLTAIGALTIPTAAQNADKLLGRNLAGGSDGTRTVQDALRSLRNKTSIAAGTLTVCAEDDSTPAWTAAVTTTPGDPLSAIDPT